MRLLFSSKSLLLLPQQCEQLLAFSVFPLSSLAGPSFSLFCHRWACLPSNTCCRKKV